MSGRECVGCAAMRAEVERETLERREILRRLRRLEACAADLQDLAEAHEDDLRELRALRAEVVALRAEVGALARLLHELREERVADECWRVAGVETARRLNGGAA